MTLCDEEAFCHLFIKSECQLITNSLSDLSTLVSMRYAAGCLNFDRFKAEMLIS